MSRLRWRGAAAGLLLLAVVMSAVGGEYSDPTGFSFTYPDGWVAATKPGQEMKEALPPDIKNWIAKNNVDLNRVSVVLIRNGRDEFLENLNVVVDRQQIPVNEGTVKKLVEQLPQKYREMGATVGKLEGRVRKIGDREAVLVEYETRLPGVPFPLKQRQVFVPGGGNTYIVTCTARADTFGQHAQTFDTILASFKAPAPAAQGWFDWKGAVTTGMIGGVIGGVVAGLTVLIKKFAGKKKPESDADSSSTGQR